MIKKNGWVKCTILSILLLFLVGCASGGRNPSMEDSCLIMKDVYIYVDKQGVTEGQDSTPEFDLTIPFLPVP